MNAIDGMFNYVSGWLNEVADWITPIDIPWHKLTQKWAVFAPYIQKYNSILPLDSLMIVAGLIVGFLAVILTLWIIKFIKSFIPLMG